MSIIHEALKRKESHQQDSAGEFRTSSRQAGPAIWNAAWFPAALGGGGILLAALLTYLLVRPGEITVVVPPPMPSAPVSTATSPVASPSGPPTVSLDAASLDAASLAAAAASPSGSEYSFQPVPTSPFGPIPVTLATRDNPGAPATVPIVPPGYASATQPLGVTPFDAAPQAPSIVTSQAPDFSYIPVYNARPTTAAPATTSATQQSAASSATTDLPSNAVTIEMSEGQLENFSGGVTVNGTAATPGTRLRVGSTVQTAASGAATLEFERASVDLSGGSTARVSRLEHRSGATTGAGEEVTVHLANGSARTIVKPGSGSVLISTPQLTAAATSGAFQVSTATDGAVTVQSEGGSVQLVPRSGAPMTLATGDRITWRNNAWVKE